MSLRLFRFVAPLDSDAPRTRQAQLSAPVSPNPGNRLLHALDRFGCGRTLHNPISRAKGSRPSATCRTVDENLGIRRNGLDDLPEASQLIQRRRLAFPYRQNVTLPACSLRIGSNIVPGLLRSLPRIPGHAGARVLYPSDSHRPICDLDRSTNRSNCHSPRFI